MDIFLTIPNPLDTTNINSPSPSMDSCSQSENSLGTITNLDTDGSESELTSLTWLTELKNIGNLSLPETTTNDNPTARFNKFIEDIRRSREMFDKRSKSFKNSTEKPPFNYSQIIGMAMMDRGKMTLKEICNWIKDNFAYYKRFNKWNNSIRHNLSLSIYFTKVARGKNEKGKGGYWKLAMDYTKTERKRIRKSKTKNKIDKEENYEEEDDDYVKNKFAKNNIISDIIITKNTEIFIDEDCNLSNEYFNETTESVANLITEQELITNMGFDEEIYIETDIPQQIDEIAIPFVYNLPQNGPNVIVENIPQFDTLLQMDTIIDDAGFSPMNFNDYDELENFLNYNQEFV